MGFGAVEGEPPGGQNPRLSESAPGAYGWLRVGLGVAPKTPHEGAWGPCPPMGPRCAAGVREAQFTLVGFAADVGLLGKRMLVY